MQVDAAHLAASTCMLYTLSRYECLDHCSRGVQLNIATQHQTCTPGMFDGTFGISSMLSACARMRFPAVSGYLRGRGAERCGQEREDSHYIV